MTRTRKVLLIDSCEADSALAGLALRHHCPGVEVVAVRTALAYADCLAAGDLQAAVCEVDLPWADGMEVLAQLRRHFPGLPLFVLAARLPAGVAATAVEHGLAGYLEKSSAGFLDMGRAVCRALAADSAAADGAGLGPAFDDLPVGLLIIAADGSIHRLTGHARELLADRGAAAEGVALEDLFPELRGQEAWQRLRRGEVERLEQTLPQAPQGGDARLSVRLSRRPGGEGVVDAMVERAEAQAVAPRHENLAEVNAELEQLAYAVSHDLQEPLQLIMRNARLLAERYEEQLRDGGGKFLGHLMESTERMQSMIDGVLAYSRLQHGERNLQPVSVDDILDQVLENLGPQIEDASASIERQPLPVVRVDRFQIQQLLTNLIGNALKFRGKRPLTVAIGAEDKGEEWQFRVRDNGIGFDGRFQDRIFKMFQRLHTSEEYPGTGIGLAVSKKIVEQYGGRMWAESREGEGAAFYFTLPK